jgi:hypothetical protein
VCALVRPCCSVHRAERIDNFRWTSGAVLSSDKAELLSSEELDYFKSYSTALNDYISTVKSDITAVSAAQRAARPIHRCVEASLIGCMPRHELMILLCLPN